MTLRIIGLLLMATAVAGCIHATEPDADRRARDSAALASIVPLVGELAVTEWRDDDWCRDFVYRGGHAMRSDEPDSCNGVDGPASAFDPVTQADFDRVDRALREAHVPVSEISRSPTAPTRIVFDLRAGMYDRFSYVFEPGYAPPENIENEWVATPIDADWYFVWEDWN